MQRKPGIVSSDIDLVVEFIHANADFFAAPFNSETFQKWASKHSDEIASLSEDMKSILFDTTVPPFIDALIGKEFTPGDKKYTLLEGDQKRLRELLAAHPEMIAAFKKHINNPIIDTWYESQATPKQIEKRNKFKKRIEDTTHTLTDYTDLFIIHLLRRNPKNLVGLTPKIKNYLISTACHINSDEMQTLANIVKNGLTNFFTAVDELIPSRKEQQSQTKGKSRLRRGIDIVTRKQGKLKKEEELKSKLEKLESSNKKNLPSELVDLYKIYGAPNSSEWKGYFTFMYEELYRFRSWEIDDVLADLKKRGYQKEAFALGVAYTEALKDEPNSLNKYVNENDKTACLRYAKEIYLETIDKGLYAKKTILHDTLQNDFRTLYENKCKEWVKNKRRSTEDLPKDSPDASPKKNRFK